MSLLTTGVMGTVPLQLIHRKYQTWGAAVGTEGRAAVQEGHRQAGGMGQVWTNRDVKSCTRNGLRPCTGIELALNGQKATLQKRAKESCGTHNCTWNSSAHLAAVKANCTLGSLSKSIASRFTTESISRIKWFFLSTQPCDIIGEHCAHEAVWFVPHWLTSQVILLTNAFGWYLFCFCTPSPTLWRLVTCSTLFP